MGIIQLYTDESKAENNALNIVTTIWGRPKDCRVYEKDIAEIVSNNRKALGKDFKKFHGTSLNNRNWQRISTPYIQVLMKLFSFIKTDSLKMLLFVESNEKYRSNSVFLKDTLASHMQDRSCPFGQIHKYFALKNLIPLFHRAANIGSRARLGTGKNITD